MGWRKKLEAVSVNYEVYEKALVTVLRSLVCANDTNAIHILRGIISVYGPHGTTHGQLAATHREAPALVDFILSKQCPVSAALTDDDKAHLLKIKQDAEGE